MTNKSNKMIFIRLAVWILLVLGLQGIQSNFSWVESSFSRGLYPIYTYLPKIFFAWLPISIGDLIYTLFCGLAYMIFRSIVLLFRKRFKASGLQVLRLTEIILIIYVFFYTSWGLNYYRIPIHEQMDINVDTILFENHLAVLDQHIQKANALREDLNFSDQSRSIADSKIEKIMREDDVFKMLSKTQVKIKKPIIGPIASYFGVSGYFNPLSNEAQVNREMPLISYPFTVAHELSHQMGIGFEDECNFIAFVKLKDNPDPWFQYSAYYQSVTYLLRTLYLVDSTQFGAYQDKLSPKVILDIKEEQSYWRQYTGWLTNVSGIFYNQYLKYNNQAEGMARYGMVSRLIIAWEQKNRQ